MTKKDYSEEDAEDMEATDRLLFWIMVIWVIALSVVVILFLGGKL